MANIDVSERMAQLHRLLEDATDVQKQAEYSYRLAAYYTNLGSPEAEAYIRRALRLALDNGEDYWAAKTCIVQSGGRNNRGDYKGAYRSLKKAWKHLRALPDCFVDKVHVCRGLALILAQQQGDMRGALRMLKLAEYYAVRADYPSAVAEVGYAAAQIYHNLNLFERSLEMLEKTLDSIRNNPAPTLQDRSTLAYAESLFGILCGQFGIWTTACLKFAESLELFRTIGYPLGEATVLQDWGNLLFDQGRQESSSQKVEEGLGKLEEANRIFRQVGSAPYYGNGMRFIGNVHAYKSDYVSALECYDKGLEIIGEVSAIGRNDILVDKASCLIKMGKGEKAIELLKKVESNRESLFAQTEVILYELLASACESVGDTSASLHYYKKWAGMDRNIISIAVQRRLLEIEFGEVVQKNRREGTFETSAEGEAGRIRLDERAKFNRELHSRTDTLLRLRSRLAELEKDSTNPAAAAGELLAIIEERNERIEQWEAFDGQLHTLDPAFFERISERGASLTPSEVRICSLLRMNLSNKEVGGLLNISDRTVDTHRTSIRRKMGLKKKENLVAFLAAL